MGEVEKCWARLSSVRPLDLFLLTLDSFLGHPPLKIIVAFDEQLHLVKTVNKKHKHRLTKRLFPGFSGYLNVVTSYFTFHNLLAVTFCCFCIFYMPL